MIAALYALFTLTIITTYMLGGQIGSAWRKYGGGATILALVIWRAVANDGGVWWTNLPLLLICPVLFIGYGDNSKLMKWLKNEDSVRFAEAALLWIPTATCAGFGLWWIAMLNLAVLLAAFHLKAGGFKILGKDFLYEDLARSTAIAITILSVLR